MKKQFLIIFCLLVNSHFLVSQKIYFRADAGYAIGVMRYTVTTQSSDIVVTNWEIVSQEDHFTDHKYSFSQGFAMELGVGIKLAKFIAVEASGFYNPGAPLTMEYSDNIYITNSGYTLLRQYQQEIDGKMIGGRINACLSYPGERLMPYLRVGVIMSSLSMNEELRMDMYDPDPNYLPTEHYNYTLEYKPHFNAGFTGGIGADYMVADRLALFAELSLNLISYVPKSAKYSEFVINGTDALPYLSVSNKEFVFTEDYDSPVPDPDEPSPQKPITIDFNNLTIAAGIRFNLFD